MELPVSYSFIIVPKWVSWIRNVKICYSRIIDNRYTYKMVKQTPVLKKEILRNTVSTLMIQSFVTPLEISVMKMVL